MTGLISARDLSPIQGARLSRATLAAAGTNPATAIAGSRACIDKLFPLPPSRHSRFCLFSFSSLRWYA
jgi:hypothetical protein